MCLTATTDQQLKTTKLLLCIVKTSSSSFWLVKTCSHPYFIFDNRSRCTDVSCLSSGRRAWSSEYYSRNWNKRKGNPVHWAVQLSKKLYKFNKMLKISFFLGFNMCLYRTDFEKLWLPDWILQVLVKIIGDECVYSHSSVIVGAAGFLNVV